MDEGRVCPLDLYLVAQNRQGCIPLKPHIDAAERKNYFTAQEAYSPFSDGVIKINTAKDLCVLRVPVLHLGERQGGIPTIKKFAVGTTAGAQSHWEQVNRQWNFRFRIAKLGSELLSRG